MLKKHDTTFYQMMKKVRKNKLSFIKKYIPSQRFKNYDIYFSDIETILDFSDEHKPVSISIVSGNDVMVFDDIIEYVGFIINNLSKSIIYFHNFGRFDSMFLVKVLLQDYRIKDDLEIVERNNIIYEVSLFSKSIIFRDSYLMIPMSLEKLGETFSDVERKFSDLDYTKISETYRETPDKIHNHCVNDALVLQDGFLNFRNIIMNEFKIDITTILTLPSLSYNIFKMSYYDESIPISKNPRNVDAFIRRSYKGGISEVFRPHLKDGFCYDANSLYPFIMKSTKFPVGIPKSIEGSRIDIKNFIGFIECEVECFEELNFLSYRCEKRGLLTPTGCWTDVYYHTEIRKALELGYKLKFLRGYRYDSEEYMFSNFVDEIYKKRVESTNAGTNSIAKLLLNSLYGRFGMKIDQITTKFLNIEKLLEINKTHFILNVNKICETNYFNVSLKLRNFSTKDEYKNSIDTETAVQIASVVTAGARIYMYKFKNLKGNKCYYTDTDSVFLEKPLEEKFLGKKLGDFKLEYLIEEAMFIAPKVYFTRSKNLEEKFVVKGIKISSPEEKTKILKNFRNIIFNSEILEPYIYGRVNYFRRFLVQLKILREDVKIVMNFPFNKRLKIFDGTTWVETKSLTMKEFAPRIFSEKN